jgi:hypothetical protein
VQNHTLNPLHFRPQTNRLPVRVAVTPRAGHLHLQFVTTSDSRKVPSRAKLPATIPESGSRTCLPYRTRPFLYLFYKLPTSSFSFFFAHHARRCLRLFRSAISSLVFAAPCRYYFIRRPPCPSFLRCYPNHLSLRRPHNGFPPEDQGQEPRRRA